MQLAEDLTAADKEAVTGFSYLLLAGVGNLSWVEWDCVIDGERTLLRLDKDQASAWAGRDIKECASSAAELQKTMNALLAIQGSYYGTGEDTALYLLVINRTREDIYGLELAFYLDGEIRNSCGGENADGSALGAGQMMAFDVLQSDLGWASLEGHELSFMLSVEDAGGHLHQLEQTYDLPNPCYGLNYNCVLTGSFDEGFELILL